MKEFYNHSILKNTLELYLAVFQKMSHRNCSFHKTVAETEDDLVCCLSDILQGSAKDAIKRNGAFRIGISGGSLVGLLTRALESIESNPEGWKFFFCDERYVPDDDNESTFYAYKIQMLPKVPTIAESQLIKADTTLTLDKCANDYAERIRSEFGSANPEFDLLLLGMGPDGHTCSLFPDRPEFLNSTEEIVIPIRNSPKPPLERITFTLPLINNAKHIVFVVTGGSKAGIVKRVFSDIDKTLPSAWVEPTHGQLTLIVDEAAGKELPNEDCSCMFL